MLCELHQLLGTPSSWHEGMKQHEREREREFIASCLESGSTMVQSVALLRRWLSRAFQSCTHRLALWSADGSVAVVAHSKWTKP
jgi:hypothetical protein